MTTRRVKREDDLRCACRWVELIDAGDTLNVLDEKGEPACKVSRLPNGGLRFRFRDGAEFKGLTVVVPLQ